MRRARLSIRILLCAALVISPIAASSMANADDLDNQKAAAERELAERAAERKELEKQLEGTNEKLAKAVLALHDVEVRIPVAKAALADAKSASQAAEREVAELAQRLADAEAELSAVQQLRVENQSLTKEAHRHMAASARQAARGDQLTIVGMITGAQSVSEFVINTTINSAVARAQARTVAAIQDSDAAARNTEARIDAIAAQITELKSQAEIAFEQRQAAEQAAINRQNEIANLYAKQSQLAKEIEDQRDEELQELEDAKADQEAMIQTIKELAAQQAERDRIIEEKRRQDALDRQKKQDAEYEAAKQAHEKCLADAKAANDAAAQVAPAPAPVAPEPPASEAGESEEPVTPAPTPTPVTTVDPATTCAALQPKASPPPVPPAATPSFGGFLGWPTDNHTVTSSYGWRYHPTLKISRLHAGTDFRAACGVPVYASQSGIVVKREWYGTGGNMVLIDHGKDDGGANIMSRYLHLSGYNVAQNQWVSKGQVIGYSGMTGGVSTGCHLHFEVYVNGSHVDPMTRLK